MRLNIVSQISLIEDGFLLKMMEKCGTKILVQGRQVLYTEQIFEENFMIASEEDQLFFFEEDQKRNNIILK